MLSPALSCPLDLRDSDLCFACPDSSHLVGPRDEPVLSPPMDSEMDGILMGPLPTVTNFQS